MNYRWACFLRGSRLIWIGTSILQKETWDRSRFIHLTSRCFPILPFPGSFTYWNRDSLLDSHKLTLLNNTICQRFRNIVYLQNEKWFTDWSVTLKWWNHAFLLVHVWLFVERSWLNKKTAVCVNLDNSLTSLHVHGI